MLLSLYNQSWNRNSGVTLSCLSFSFKHWHNYFLDKLLVLKNLKSFKALHLFFTIFFKNDLNRLKSCGKYLFEVIVEKQNGTKALPNLTDPVFSIYKVISTVNSWHSHFVWIIQWRKCIRNFLNKVNTGSLVKSENYYVWNDASRFTISGHF